MQDIKCRFGAKSEQIKQSGDLVYLDIYRHFADDKYAKIRREAEDIFNSTGDLKAVDDFFRKKYGERLAEKYKKEANINKKFAKRTFENYIVNNQMQKDAKEKAFQYAENIEQNIENGKNIIFIGNGSVGTGKTHLACAIANKVLDKGIPVKVLNVINLVDTLKSFDESKRNILRKIDVLLIDDLGKENGTIWLCSEIYGIINARYENELPTIITTEGNLSDLENNYVIDIDGQRYNKGRSMVSRLMESCVGVFMQGEDYRLTKGEQWN